MKLFVIVLCLLSERFLIHTASQSRFYWFPSYFKAMYEHLPFKSAWGGVAWVVLPLLLFCWLILFIFANLFFGFIGLLLHLVIFYYCLGPENTFYPVRQDNEDESEATVGYYFVKANKQLFAAVFWYIVFGPLGALLYRLVSLCQQQSPTEEAAKRLTNLLDWIPARLSVLFYLLVGNFQQGFRFFTQRFFSPPEGNDRLLSKGGLLAAYSSEKESVTMPCAENIVEHALVVYLVFLALFTLVIWL